MDMSTAEFMEIPSTWIKFPFSHPSSFQKIMAMLDTSTILACRRVCSDWRDWFSISSTVWASVLSNMVAKSVRRRLKFDLEQIWDIRLDLLLEMVDECWTVNREMQMAIRIERATNQSIWFEFEDTLKVVNQLHQACSRGLMASPCVGPVSIFLRSKVAHPSVLRVMGETMARHLNCVIIDEGDKETSVVRQCLLRAMISCRQAPRWVFKDMDLGWFGEDEDEKTEETEVSDDDQTPENMPSKISLTFLLTSFFNFVSSLLSPIWRMAISFQEEEHQDTSLEDYEEEEEENIYTTSPPPMHPVFPTVLELLDCDSPWIKKLLVDKVGIDKILVVPKFEEVTKYVEDLDDKFTVAGLDLGGSVCQLDCGALARREGATVGYVDYPAANFNGEGMKVHFWGGRDVKGRWPEFEKILEGIEGPREEEEPEADWSDTSEDWSEEDLKDDADHCNENESDTSRTSDLGVSPDLSNSGSGGSGEHGLDSSDSLCAGEGDYAEKEGHDIAKEGDDVEKEGHDIEKEGDEVEKEGHEIQNEGEKVDREEIEHVQ